MKKGTKHERMALNRVLERLSRKGDGQILILYIIYPVNGYGRRGDNQISFFKLSTRERLPLEEQEKWCTDPINSKCSARRIFHPSQQTDITYTFFQGVKLWLVIVQSNHSTGIHQFEPGSGAGSRQSCNLRQENLKISITFSSSLLNVIKSSN
jgi:hypothetical protein